MGIKLFCDRCENSDDFEKVQIIEKYDSKQMCFKPVKEGTTYIRCNQCGDVDPLEVGDEKE